MDTLPQIIMRMPDLSKLPSLQLPQGMELHTHRAGDEQSWESIIESSFGRHFTFQQLIDMGSYHPDYVQYIAKDGKDIATASAVENPNYPGEGWFRMVGTHKDAQGLGAGKLVCLAALHSLQKRGYKTAVLSTDDERLPAIRLYLSLGFRPLYNHPSHQSRWEKIFKNLEAMGYKKSF